MQESRRDFLRALGVLLASTLSGCMTSCYTPATSPSPTVADAWDRLRKPWLDLDLLARDAKDLARGEATRDRLIAEHRTALDLLVAARRLDSAVADDVHVAFVGAASHIWRMNAPITCYVPSMGPDYAVKSRVQLATQADALTEMATKSQIDEATVALARAAIERDLAYLTLSAQDQQALTQQATQQAGTSQSFPSLAELGLNVPDECAAAAQVLVELLLGRKQVISE